MKIYTKKGDQGETRLIDGETVRKNHPRLVSCGDLDELNAALGFLISALPDSLRRIVPDLEMIQQGLMTVGAQLIAVQDQGGQPAGNHTIHQGTRHLEEKIDQMQAELPECRGFILPGGHESACRAHLARTVCRRAERSIAGLADGMKTGIPDPDILPFINRLSDYLFVLARYCNMKTETGEKSWNR
jgi:cob(I)alamin adenosyltransferase